MAQQQQISASENTLKTSQQEKQYGKEVYSLSYYSWIQRNPDPKAPLLTREYEDCFFYVGKSKFVTEHGCIHQIMQDGKRRSVELVKFGGWKNPYPTLRQNEDGHDESTEVKDKDKLREIERKVEESEALYIRGEFFPVCDRIVTEKSARFLAYDSVDFHNEYESRIHNEDCHDWKKGDTEVTSDEAFKAVKERTLEGPINDLPGCHMRSDGMVEIERGTDEKTGYIIRDRRPKGWEAQIRAAMDVAFAKNRLKTDPTHQYKQNPHGKTTGMFFMRPEEHRRLLKKCSGCKDLCYVGDDFSESLNPTCERCVAAA